MSEKAMGIFFSVALIMAALVDGLIIRDGRVCMVLLGVWILWHVCAGVVESWQARKDTSKQ